MGLIDHNQKIIGEIVNQRIRTGPRRQTVNMTGVVFNALAGADFPQTFPYRNGYALNSLRLQRLPRILKPLHLPRSSSSMVTNAFSIFSLEVT